MTPFEAKYYTHSTDGEMEDHRCEMSWETPYNRHSKQDSTLSVGLLQSQDLLLLLLFIIITSLKNGQEVFLSQFIKQEFEIFIFINQGCL